MKLVSCIMPTYNRRRFVPQAIEYFLRQDYPDKELIIVDDGTDSVADFVPDNAGIRYIRLDRKRTIGAKRNLACKAAKGEIIVHWDDDDWMAPWRLTYQVESLLKAGADICGLDKVFFYDATHNRSWQYIYPKASRAWVCGGTLCYTKSHWQRHPFPDINIGEDNRFVWANHSQKVVTLADNRFYVGIVHSENTSPKRTGDRRWQVHPIEEIQTLINGDLSFYTDSPQQDGREVLDLRNDLPLVSCIMPTYNRRHFVPQAIKYFLRQDYPNRELIIVDDGTDVIADLIPEDSRIRYIQRPKKQSIGAKRNLACETANGEIIVFWDDDDWYAASRISYQVEPLLAGTADVTGLDRGLLLCLPTKQFWACTPELHARMFVHAVIGGTLTFWKKFWHQGLRFRNLSLAEDAAFLKALIGRGARLEKLSNTDVFVYLRHDTNSWRFTPGNFLGRKGWQQVELPSFIPKSDLEFYVGERPTPQQPKPVPKTQTPNQTDANGGDVNMKKVKTQDTEGQKPINDDRVTVSIPYFRCKPYICQAVESILGQTHKNLTLIVVNDGDEEVPWDLLAHIDDPRLVRFDLGSNHGRYFADAVVLNATTAPFFAIQDADDWSEPNRISSLLEAIKADGTVGAISASNQHGIEDGVITKKRTSRFSSVQNPLTKTFEHRANHTGLFRSDALKRIGGYFNGFRVGYDTLVVNLLQMSGDISYVNEPLYNVILRSDSLTHSEATGKGTPARRKVGQQLAQMYREAFEWYTKYRAEKIQEEVLFKHIRDICARHITQSDDEQLKQASDQLRVLLSAPPESRGTRLKNGSKKKTTSILRKENGVQTMDQLLDSPHLTWNDWTISKRLAIELTIHLEKTKPERILEIGSGTSTVFLAHYAAQHQAKVVSVEHDRCYYEKTAQQLIEMSLMDAVELRLAPFISRECADGSSYPWYHTYPSDKFDFIFVDAPPLKYGRQATLFALSENLNPNKWELWMKDGKRDHEQMCVEIWKQHLQFSSQLCDSDYRGVWVLKSLE